MNTKQRLLIIGVSLAVMVLLGHFVRRVPVPSTGSRPNTEFHEVYNKFVAHGKMAAEVNEEWQRCYRGRRVTWSGRFVENYIHYHDKTYLRNIGAQSPHASVAAALSSPDDAKKIALLAGRWVVYSATLDSFDLESGLLKVKDFELLKIEEQEEQ